VVDRSRLRSRFAYSPEKIRHNSLRSASGLLFRFSLDLRFGLRVTACISIRFESCLPFRERWNGLHRVAPLAIALATGRVALAGEQVLRGGCGKMFA
jgi:hypothetical protein